jgi:hypothetical protein
MIRLFCTAIAALFLVSCGGGDAGVDAAAGSPLAAKVAAPNPTLQSEPASLVNTTTEGVQVLRTVGATSDGGYVVAWLSNGTTLFIQAYDSSGAKVGGETMIPLTISASSPAEAAAILGSSSVAVLADGTLVVGYTVSRHADQPNGTVLTTTGVYFQRFDAAGNQLMGETEVASRSEVLNSRSPTTSTPTVVALADGGFVVGWQVNSFSAMFGYNGALSLRWFDGQGQPVGASVDVGSFPASSFSIAADPYGGFTLTTRQSDATFHTLYAVSHYAADHSFRELVTPRLGPVLLLPLRSGYVLFANGPSGATAQLLDAEGQPVGTATAVPVLPLAALELADGTFVAAWSAGGGLTTQRYTAGAVPIGDPLPITSGIATPQFVALMDTGFVAAWSAPSAAIEPDVFAQRFMEVASASKKACLNRAKAAQLKGQERMAFMAACMG